MNNLFSGTARLSNRLLPGLGLFAFILMVAGCNTLILTPVGPNDLRELYKSGKVSADKFMVKRPFSSVVHDLKVMNDKCMDKVLPVAPLETIKPGVDTPGFVHYVPDSSIRADRAEFYVRKRVIPPGAKTESGDQFIYYVVDVVPQGSQTAVRIIYANQDVQRWARSVKNWAMGDDFTCPVLTPSS